MFLSIDLLRSGTSRAVASLFVGAALLLMSGCATPEPPQVKLEQANILPLAINPDFTSVSYTHLDVYKRQIQISEPSAR